jgi:hypothetical protein
MTQEQMVTALRGMSGAQAQPPNPTVSALFSHTPQQLQGLRHMAGEVVPFPIDPRLPDQRRMMNEDFMKDLHTRFGQPGIDQYRRMWPAAPVVPGPGANE